MSSRTIDHSGLDEPNPINSDYGPALSLHAIPINRCCFHDERRVRCRLEDLHDGECVFNGAQHG